MELDSLEEMLWRSWKYALSLKKILVVSVFLFIVMTIFTFCQSLAVSAAPWVKSCLFFLPFFVSVGFTLSLSIFLCRVYWKNIKGKEVHYSSVVKGSWELFLTSSFVSVPLFLLFLVLWIVIGLFYLIQEVPLFGGFLGSLLSFAPFVLILLTLVLTLSTVVMLFVIPPTLALEKKDKYFWKSLKERLLMMLPSYSLFFTIGVIPLVMASILVLGAFFMTDYLYLQEDSPLLRIFQWFVLNVPISVFLSLPFVFFVQFALETHIHLTKRKKELSYHQQSKEEGHE